MSKLGHLEHARIIDGDPRLVKNSLQALKHWRWKPYVLNGEATGMESTVVFEYKADSGKVLINPAPPATVDVPQGLSVGSHQ